MTSQEERPGFIVGIDFGQTYTGVAWSNLATSTTQSIQDWPGLPPDSVETKVPTKIIIPHDGSEPRWGFLCNLEDDYQGAGEVREHFKIYLDQETIHLARKEGVKNVVGTTEEALTLITEYLRQIHQHIKFSIESQIGPWTEKKIEFLFSLPTTWTSFETTNKFNKAIVAAGFSSENPTKHSAKLELTEAEAAAVYVATNPQVALRNKDIILICDAGGGTTDLGLIEVHDANPKQPLLKQVAAVKGVGVGSTMIDRAFEALVQRRLNAHPDTMLPKELAHKIARGSSFQSIKHNFGTKAATQEVYKLALDRLGLGISPQLEHLGLGISSGKMQFLRAEIQELFDIQIIAIIRQITQQLDWMQINRFSEQVKMLVLSGGLGGSQYVKTKIQEFYTENPHPNAPNLSILKSQEPRLAVVKGLVLDRRQKLVSGTATLKTRIARASYGVLCRQPYDPRIHVDAEIVTDNFKKKQKWALAQIDWLIVKGDTIDTSGAHERTFSRKLVPGDPNRIWRTMIVISHEDRKDLPRSYKHPGAFKLCEIESDLTGIGENEFELKNRKIWQGKKFYVATFSVKVIIAPADLRFELWFKGMKYNKGHDAITVQWDEVGAAVKPKMDGGAAWELDAIPATPQGVLELP
ncbi:hypothetical protein LSUB1_G004387 [Lachnellula subtilissima]|uniref:Uncharacterized protein n=1 Tax=Lachnellula subtilissima TaxID=602034 RepID=A0A8H8U8U3_9HELO|nr:hypothetical protein LSUB1_G004387 [Lachnellula subtilissima]